MKPIQQEYDCLVMGGGPAGSTAAALVAEAGYRTLLVERAAMPRASVGESLMPETYWIFKRLGVLDQLQASQFPRKVGVQFVGSSGRESAPFFFRSHDPRDCSQTWHVDRSQFDWILLQNAISKGADCHDHTRVLKGVLDNDRAVGVRLQPNAPGDPSQFIKARVVVDATGQQALLGNQLGLRRPNPQLRKVAIWGHFRGGLRDQSGGGVKTVILHTDSKRSWFWYIPLADNRVSVGLVGDHDKMLNNHADAETVFYHELQQCKVLQGWLDRAEPINSLQVLREFSYSQERAAGDGWVLVGDAWGFIDPVYSSGVFFAMKSAELAADAILEGLQCDDLSATMLGRWLPEFTQRTNLIRKLVAAFYSGNFRVGKFIQQYPQHRKELVDLLIGRIFDPQTGSHQPGKIFDDLDPWLLQMEGE
ncbi:MAG: NAD(P)/FAD-dependent oxidoreductase [Pirellulales bacterium]